MEKYIELETIAKGTYGETFKVEYNKLFFCKKIYLTDNYKYGYTQDFVKEVMLLNENYTLLEIYDISTTNTALNDMYIIIQYYNNSLSDFIANHSFIPRHLTSTNISNILPSILQQLYNIHKIGFIHSDLKLDNILEKDGAICICDWGLSEYYGYPKAIKEYICSRYYKAPDIRISINVDLFGLGASMYYLLTGISMGYKDNLYDTDIDRKCISIKKRLSITEVGILKELIKPESKRPSAKKILMRHYNFIPVYIDNHIETINKLFKDIKIDSFDNSNLQDDVFYSSDLKRILFEKYTYNDLLNSKSFELEYLDDTFSYFYNHNIQVTTSKDNYMDGINKLLFCYFNINIDLNTFFQAISIFNMIHHDIDFNKYRLSDIIKIVLNYSCKICEPISFDIKLKNIQLEKIIDIEFIIIDIFRKKKIEFLPYTFYVYYYITKIIQKYSEYYRKYLRNLESICLSMLFIVLININTSKNINLHMLSLNIVFQATYFIMNNKLDISQDICKLIITHYKLIPNNYILNIIENQNFRKYLYNLSFNEIN